MLFVLLRLALTLAEHSGRLFDPPLRADLGSSGSLRCFGLRPPPLPRTPDATRRHRIWRDVSLDASTRRITMPEGCGLDLGGIGKGWAVDRLASMLGTVCLVNGGGDVYAAGKPPGNT